jgi:hypothetical protein
MLSEHVKGRAREEESSFATMLSVSKWDAAHQRSRMMITILEHILLYDLVGFPLVPVNPNPLNHLPNNDLDHIAKEKTIDKLLLLVKGVTISYILVGDMALNPLLHYMGDNGLTLQTDQDNLIPQAEKGRHLIMDRGRRPLQGERDHRRTGMGGEKDRSPVGNGLNQF